MAPAAAAWDECVGAPDTSDRDGGRNLLRRLADEILGPFYGSWRRCLLCSATRISTKIEPAPNRAFQ